MAIKLKGHETFALREGWLNKGLKEVKKSSEKDISVFAINHGADALGVGTNMAKAIRYWLKAGNLIEEAPKRGAFLSKLGKIIYENDTYLEDNFALWLFHINLAWNKDMATSWYLFFNEINLDEFTKEELVSQLIAKLTPLAEGKNVAERSVRDDATVLLHMYVKEKIENYDPEEKKISPFSKLTLIRRDGERFIKSQPSIDEMDDYVVLYSMLRYFENKGSREAGIDELLSNPLSPGRILNLKRVALNEYIDNLAAKKYVIVNRTAGLDMVYLNTNKTTLDIVNKYYESRV